MVQVAVVACVSLYLVSIIACWRIADYFCVGCRWLLLFPVINLVYFSKLTDVIAVEAHDTEKAYSRFAMIAALSVLLTALIVYQFKQNELVVLGSEIALILSGIFTLLTFCWCYMTVIQNSFNFPSLVCLMSLLVPFPVWLFIASFTIQGKTAEVVELYWG